MAAAPAKEMITGNAEGSGALTAEGYRCSETQIPPQATMSVIYDRRTVFYKAPVTFKKPARVQFLSCASHIFKKRSGFGLEILLINSLFVLRLEKVQQTCIFPYSPV